MLLTMDAIKFDINDAIDCNNWYTNSNQPIFVMKCNGGDISLCQMNKSAYELLKCNIDDFSNLTPLNIGLFQSNDDMQKYIDSIIGPEGVTYLTHIIPKTENPISSEITLYRNPNSDYLVAFQQNTGNTSKMLNALRHSEYRFLLMAESIADGIVIYENGKMVFSNTAMHNITGYSKEQIRDMDELSFACDYERERAEQFISERQQMKQKVYNFEFWIRTRTGQEKFVRNSYTIVKSLDGDIVTMYLIVDDHTSQKLAERAMLKSQTEFKMLADNSPDLITRYNRDLTYSFVNKAVEEVTKIPSVNIIGRNTIDIDIDQETASFIEEMHLEVFRTGRKLKFEFRMNIDGHQHIYQACMVPELSKDGSVNTVLNVSRDITQIKDVENELNREKRNIIESNNLIASNLKLLGVKLIETCPELKGTSAMSSVYRISEWIGVDSRLMKLEPKTIDVCLFLDEYYNRRYSDAESKGISLKLDKPQPILKIYADTQIISLVLNCLVDNSMEADGVSQIDIGYGTTENDEIVFFVKDNGNGIPSDVQAKIFEPFQSFGKNGHSGLGLSTAKKCVEQLKGRIWCYSNANEGSQFFFTQPIGVQQPEIKPANTDKKRWASKKIHVVEDTDANYMLIEAMLKPQGQPQLTRSVNGQHAIDYVRNNPDIDLILMDIQLPDINGYEVTQQIRTFNTKVPIIAQTAYAMYADVVKALDSGCNDFIAKPIKIKKMMSLLEKYLG